MANGDYFTKEELREFIKPLEVLKEAINSYAKEVGMDTVYYYKGWPGISLEWNNIAGLECRIYLSLNNENQKEYVMGVQATKDVEKKRYSIGSRFHENLKPPFDKDFIMAEIRRGLEIASAWKFEDLKFSTILK
jgi:hypothetical protein